MAGGYQPPYYPRKSTQKPLGRKNRGSLPKTQRKALPKKPSNSKRTDASQNRAIMTLSKQIKALQMDRYGMRQKNFQQTEQSFNITGSRPILFDLTDFTCRNSANPGYDGAQLYRRNAAGALDNISLWTADFPNPNPFFDCNYDIVNGGAYYPEYVKLNIRIQGRPNVSDTRVRIDVFSQKAGTIKDNVSGAIDDMRLPQALPFFEDLATPNQNRISTSHFNLYKTKWVYINSSKTDPNVKGTTGNTSYVTMSFRPKKLRVQAITAPELRDDNAADTGEILYGDFGPDNSSIDAPLWVLISTSDTNAPGDAGSIFCDFSRTCVWRDPIGSSKVSS